MLYVQAILQSRHNSLLLSPDFNLFPCSWHWGLPPFLCHACSGAFQLLQWSYPAKLGGREIKKKKKRLFLCVCVFVLFLYFFSLLGLAFFSIFESLGGWWGRSKHWAGSWGDEGRGLSLLSGGELLICLLTHVQSHWSRARLHYCKHV